jgi:hypothetical protein
MPIPTRRPTQQQTGLGTRLLTRMGDWVDDRVADARDWADDRAADAKGAALDVATRFQPFANAISKLPPPLGLNEGRAPPGPEKAPPPPSADDFTELSRGQESGRGGPGTISHTPGDPGGPSYGSYQFATNFGVPQRFLKTYGGAWTHRFQGQEPGSPAFDQTWKAIAQEDLEGFERAQRAFIGHDYFNVQADMIRRHTGLDLSDRSRALKNVVFSTAVQHGPNSALISSVVLALEKANPGRRLTDQQIIDGIYDERGRTNAKGGLVHFPSSPQKYLPGLKARFPRERMQAQAMLKAER